MKNKLKAWIRYDGTGKVIPFSLRYAKNKPKNGDWKEVAVSRCCTGYTYIYVCGAGTAGVDGTYAYAGMRNGKPYYTKDTLVISWGEYPDLLDWEIYDSELVDTWYYYGNEDVITPNLASWIADDGESPVPTVSVTAC